MHGTYNSCFCWMHTSMVSHFFPFAYSIFVYVPHVRTKLHQYQIAWCRGIYFFFLLCPFAREDKLVEHAKSLKVDAGSQENVDIGPVISKQVDT